MKSAHFILQGKGGVGKSFVSTILAQYLIDRTDVPVYCYDTDPVNQTFSRFEALGAEMVPILNQDDVIDSRKFDSLIESIMSKDGIAVIDNGAATFVPLVAYLAESGATELLVDSGINVYFHVIVTGGQAMPDTLFGLNTVLTKLGGKVVVWANEFFGEISGSSGKLSDFKVINENHDKILGIVTIPRRTADTFGKDIAEMMTAHLTFAEAQQTFNLLPRQRLKMVQRDLYEQLSQQSFSGCLTE